MKIKCPKCKGTMVKRQRRKDGHPFYGCSSYPTCKHTMSVKRYEEAGWNEIGDHPSGGLEDYGDIVFGDSDWF